MTSEHERLRTDLGAYLLGALPPDDERAVEDHLATCASCRAELDELAPAAAALSDLKVGGRATATTAVDVPAGLEPLVLGRIAEEQGRDRRTSWTRRAALAAVAGAAAAVVLVVVGLAVIRDDRPPAPSVPLEAVGVTVREKGVTAAADLVAHTWGVEVKLTAAGFDEGARYRVDVIGTNGKHYPAGEFVGTGSREMHCNLNSSVLRDRATGFEVLDRDGDVVVRSTFT